MKFKHSNEEYAELILSSVIELAANDPEIELLWLYGSRAKGTHSLDSDFDFAIAFQNPEGGSVDSRLRSEIKAVEWSEVVGVSSDLISVLDINLSPLPLAMSVVTSGKVLLAKSGLRLAREENKILSMWELDHEFHRREFDELYADSIKEELSTIKEELDEINSIANSRKLSILEYRALERDMQLLIEIAVGLAKRVLKAQKLVVPSDSRQSFEKLASLGQDTTGIDWVRVIGMRNALVHDYLDIDKQRVLDVLMSGECYRLFEFCSQFLKLED